MYLPRRERAACLSSRGGILLADVSAVLSRTRVPSTRAVEHLESVFNTERRRILLGKAYARAEAFFAGWPNRDERYSWMLPVALHGLLGQIDSTVWKSQRSSTAAFAAWNRIVDDLLACELLSSMRDLRNWMPWISLELLSQLARMRGSVLSELRAAVIRTSFDQNVEIDDTAPLARMPESLRCLPSSFVYQLNPLTSLQHLVMTLERAGAVNVGHLAALLHPELQRGVRGLESGDWIIIRDRLREDPVVALEHGEVQYVDNRLRGGALWVVDRGRGEEALIRSLATGGMCFQHAPHGSRSTKNRPGWWYRGRRRFPAPAAQDQLAHAPRGTAEAHFAQALRTAEAGRIALDASDEPVAIRQTLHRAARRLGIRVRSSWTDESQSVLEWKAVR